MSDFFTNAHQSSPWSIRVEMVGGHFIRVGGKQRFDDLVDNFFETIISTLSLLHLLKHAFTSEKQAASRQGLVPSPLTWKLHCSGSIYRPLRKQGVLHLFKLGRRNKEYRAYMDTSYESIHLVMEEPLFYTSDMMKLIVFLGSPGKIYEPTRHNVGWMVAKRRTVRSPGARSFSQNRQRRTDPFIETGDLHE